ncbi:MAG: phosphoribosylformylglycinamidine cyclo-ligase [bacterium]|nr:phosphoribosylformylglycinamidine cyclo-ligase [bacterium]
MTYKDAGVDIAKGWELIKGIRPLVKTTNRAEVLTDIGGFSGLFEAKFERYKEPVLVSSCDGVGTKLKIASLLRKHDTIGIDLVAMGVNDLVTAGAEPLFFLDYLGMGKLEIDIAEDIIKGIVAGCKEANCSLLGGETAEMPGFYREGEYELVGFSVGVVDKDKIIDGQKIKPGDKVIGLSSSGLHSNGYSLVRKILDEELAHFKEELLTPTKIYVRPILSAKKKFDIKGIAHITGGGFDNIKRILPQGLSCEIKEKDFPTPSIFHIIQKRGNICKDEMYRTFNMGIGMVVVLSEKDAPFAMEDLKNFVSTYLIGEIKEGKQEVRII